MPHHTTIDQLTARVLRHRDERQWGQFHTPKELAISLCVESAELLARLQWMSGVELAAARTLGTSVTLRVAYTWSRLRFGEYRPVAGTAADTLDGHRVPGVPEHFLRGAFEARLFGAVLRVDQSVASRVFADARNTIAVDGWNVTDLGISWETRQGRVRILPNGGIRNVFGNRYTGSVTVNGAFGRVFEPAPGRNGWIGVELRFDRVRASSPDPGL